MFLELFCIDWCMHKCGSSWIYTTHQQQRDKRKLERLHHYSRHNSNKFPIFHHRFYINRKTNCNLFFFLFASLLFFAWSTTFHVHCIASTLHCIFTNDVCTYVHVIAIGLQMDKQLSTINYLTKIHSTLTFVPAARESQKIQTLAHTHFDFSFLYVHFFISVWLPYILYREKSIHS